MRPSVQASRFTARTAAGDVARRLPTVPRSSDGPNRGIRYTPAMLRRSIEMATVLVVPATRERAMTAQVTNGPPHPSLETEGADGFS